MRATIQYIKSELAELYPETEIKGFIRIIFESVLNLSYTDIILQNDNVINPKNFEQIKSIVLRLKAFEPIQYILGECEFYGLKIKVNPAVLIPRPETEELVEQVIKSHIKPNAKIIDIGTGSACIALAIKSVRSKMQVSAVDVSAEALNVAAANASQNQLDVLFSKADILNWRKYTWPKYDVIVSNPPYVRKSEKKLMESNVLKYEPDGALFVEDDDPLIFYRTIAEFALEHLEDKGYLFFEINEYLGAEMKTMLQQLGFASIKIQADINGKVRVLTCRKNC